MKTTQLIKSKSHLIKPFVVFLAVFLLVLCLNSSQVKAAEEIDCDFWNSYCDCLNAGGGPGCDDAVMPSYDITDLVVQQCCGFSYNPCAFTCSYSSECAKEGTINCSVDCSTWECKSSRCTRDTDFNSCSSGVCFKGVCNSPPGIYSSCFSPANDSWHPSSGIQLQVGVYDSESDAAMVYFELHYPNGDVVTYSSNYVPTSPVDIEESPSCDDTAVVNLPALSQGTYTWRAKAYDGFLKNEGNWSSYHTFKVDATQPSVSWDSPDDSTEYYDNNSTYTIKVNASDADSGLNKCEYTYNNGSNWYTLPNCDYTFPGTRANQKATFKVRAIDNVGNIKESSSRDLVFTNIRTVSYTHLTLPTN